MERFCNGSGILDSKRFITGYQGRIWDFLSDAPSIRGGGGGGTNLNFANFLGKKTHEIQRKIWPIRDMLGP